MRRVNCFSKQSARGAITRAPSIIWEFFIFSLINGTTPFSLSIRNGSSAGKRYTVRQPGENLRAGRGSREGKTSDAPFVGTGTRERNRAEDASRIGGAMNCLFLLFLLANGDVDRLTKQIAESGRVLQIA